MSAIKPLFSEATGLFKKLLANRLVPTGILFVIGNSITINIEDQIALLKEQGPSPDLENFKLMLTLGLGIWDMVESVLLLLILSWGLPAVRPLKGPKFLQNPFSRPYIGTFLAEYLRVLGQVLLWGILFIIPGFVRYVRLIFVPLIVFFSKDYDDDKIDALELSTQLTRACFKPLVAIILAVTVSQVVLEMTPHAALALHILPVRLAFNLTSFLISIWSYSLIVVLFLREMEK